MKVLFVCRANTGRSQMAEAIFSQLAAGMHEASSAGTRVNNPEDVYVEQRPHMEAILQSMDDEFGKGIF